AAIESRTSAPDETPLEIAYENDAVVVSLGAGELEEEASLWLVGFDGEETVTVKRGENHGHRFTYHNVVRLNEKIGAWTGAPLAVTLPFEDFARRAGEAFVVLVQEGETGPILAARRITLPR